MFLISTGIVFKNNTIKTKKDKFFLIKKYTEHIDKNLNLKEFLNNYLLLLKNDIVYTELPIYEDGFSFIEDEPLVINNTLYSTIVEHITHLNNFINENLKKGYHISIIR